VAATQIVGCNLAESVKRPFIQPACLGYPFHPPGAPERLRTSHLAKIKTPTLICQGTRDMLGSREEVAGYALSDRIELFWLEDGDHDLKPRKRVSG
jgi:predicted alpha/beta-hydrolase family hydrolase